MSGSPASLDVTINRNPAKWLIGVLVLAVTLAGIGLRFAGLKFVSGDMRLCLLDWYDKLASGGFATLREPFSNYAPPYLYLLFLATKTAGVFSKLTAIKLLSISFDFLNAFWVYKILKLKFPQGAMPLIGASAFLLLPTVILNSAYWGQCDSIYTFFVLACLFFLMKEWPLVAMISFGVSFAFKAQAVFLAPFLFLLVLRKRMPWFYLGIIPLVYALMMIPAALTGRSFIELLTIYAGQAEEYSALSVHAPNLYLLFPKSWETPGMALIGFLFTMILALAWTRIYAKKMKEFTPPAILLCALMSVAFMPFFLPKMHERYFYLADVTSFLIAFYFPRGWLLTIGYQLTSGLAYSTYLYWSIMAVNPALAGNLLLSAFFINITLMGFIFLYSWNLIPDTSHMTPKHLIHDN